MLLDILKVSQLYVNKGLISLLPINLKVHQLKATANEYGSRMTSMFRGKRAIVAYVGFILAATKGYAQEDTYLELIKPVLKARCYACHGALKQEADLRTRLPASKN